MSKATISILVCTFITVIGWIGSEVFHATQVVDYPDEYREIETISSYFDKEILEEIVNRKENDLYTPFSE